MTDHPHHTPGGSHADSAAEHADAASIVEEELPDTTDEQGAPVENPSG